MVDVDTPRILGVLKSVLWLTPSRFFEVFYRSFLLCLRTSCLRSLGFKRSQSLGNGAVINVLKIRIGIDSDRENCAARWSRAN